MTGEKTDILKFGEMALLDPAHHKREWWASVVLSLGVYGTRHWLFAVYPNHYGKGDPVALYRVRNTTPLRLRPERYTSGTVLSQALKLREVAEAEMDKKAFGSRHLRRAEDIALYTKAFEEFVAQFEDKTLLDRYTLGRRQTSVVVPDA